MVKYFRALLLPAVISSVVLLLAVQAHATTIYSNGVPDLQNAHNITAFRGADDFILAGSATVAAIRFWGSTNVAGGIPAAFSGTISWAIYNDAGGALGAVAGSGATSSIVPVPTGNFVLGLFADTGYPLRSSSAYMLWSGRSVPPTSCL